MKNREQYRENHSEVENREQYREKHSEVENREQYRESRCKVKNREKYRRFIDKFSEVARPLTNLTKKNVVWEWGPTQSAAFEELKTALTSAPILKPAEPGKPYILRTDASAYALGAALLQGEGNEERPVGNEHQTWPEKLASIRFAMNTTRCQSTGFSPAYLTFGQEPRTPSDVKHDLRAVILSENFIPEVTPRLVRIVDTLKEAREKHEAEQDRQKHYADQHRRPGPQIQPGDRVNIKVCT